ncbi:MAG: TetR/AcrR family transcriptional regulator [Trebonia sp.]
MTHPNHPSQATAGPAPVRGGQEPGDRSARKRRVITDAATALFLRNGYLGTSMDQIAVFAAVSKPTVYKFFADKEQLLTAIVLETLDLAGSPFLDELARLAETDRLADDMRQLARRYVATVTQPPVLQLRRLVIGASHQLPHLARTYYERAPEQTLRALAACFRRLGDRGLLRLPDPETAAAHFAFLVLGRALDKSMFCGDQPFSPGELEAQADAGAAAFITAYGHG